jgi:hypothetical protein
MYSKIYIEENNHLLHRRTHETLKIVEENVRQYIGQLMLKILPKSPIDHKEQVCPIMIFDTKIVENIGQTKLAIYYLVNGEKQTIHITANYEFFGLFQPCEGFDEDVTYVNEG